MPSTKKIDPPRKKVEDPVQLALIVAIVIIAIGGLIGGSQSKEHSIEILGFCGLIIASLTNLIQNRRTEVKQVEVAEKVAEVAVKAEGNSTTVNDKLDVIHDLVNNKMHLALTALADATRENADRTGKPEDIQKADKAAAELVAHDRQQSIVDAKQAKKSQ